MEESPVQGSEEVPPKKDLYSEKIAQPINIDNPPAPVQVVQNIV